MVDPTYSSSYSVRQPRAAAIVLFTMTAVGQNATDNFRSAQVIPLSDYARQ
jgi:hypothetical protein